MSRAIAWKFGVSFLLKSLYYVWPDAGGDGNSWLKGSAIIVRRIPISEGPKANTPNMKMRRSFVTSGGRGLQHTPINGPHNWARLVSSSSESVVL